MKSTQHTQQTEQQQILEQAEGNTQMEEQTQEQQEQEQQLKIKLAKAQEIIKGLDTGAFTIQTDRLSKLRKAVEILGDNDPLVSRLVGELHSEIGVAISDNLGLLLLAHGAFFEHVRQLLSVGADAASNRIPIVTLTIGVEGNPSTLVNWVDSNTAPVLKPSTPKPSTTRRIHPVVKGVEYDSPKTVCEKLGLEAKTQKSRGRLIRRWADTLEEYCQENKIPLKWV